MLHTFDQILSQSTDPAPNASHTACVRASPPERGSPDFVPPVPESNLSRSRFNLLLQKELLVCACFSLTTMAAASPTTSMSPTAPPSLSSSPRNCPTAFRPIT